MAIIKLATAPTLEAITKIINQYFYSTSFEVKPETLEIHNSKGLVKNFNVTKKGKRYYFNQI